jgi:hypothetical protein
LPINEDNIMNEVSKLLDEKLEELKEYLSDNMGNVIIIKFKVPYSISIQDITSPVKLLQDKLNMGSEKIFKIVPIYVSNTEDIDFEILLNDSEKINKLEKRISELENKIKFLYS